MLRSDFPKLARIATRYTLILSWLLLLSLLAFSQQNRQRPNPAARPPAQDFNQLAARASSAREATQLNEAIKLYRQALQLKPDWDEGWWYLATMLYDRNEYPEAIRAFQKVTKLRPNVGSTWAMLGLCEFQVGNYPEALTHLQKGRQIGLADNKDLSRALFYHESLILIIEGQFEQAQKTLDEITYGTPPTDNLILALGLSVLRVPILPKDIDLNNKDNRELFRRAGAAEFLVAQKKFTEAQQEYERLAADYPKALNVQYAYGRFLVVAREDEKAVEAFKREIENSPNHSLARLQIAYIKLLHKEPLEGVKYAEEAVKLNTASPLTHYVLGRVLFDAGQTEKAIVALETARRLSPDDAKIYFSLSRAYTRAKRKADADQARETFERLSRLTEKSAQQGTANSEAIDANAKENSKSVSP